MILQVMHSLDHLVTDIEHVRGVGGNIQRHQRPLPGFGEAKNSFRGHGTGARHVSTEQSAVDHALADITAQLSSQYDLHDTWY